MKSFPTWKPYLRNTVSLLKKYRVHPITSKKIILYCGGNFKNDGKEDERNFNEKKS